MNTVTAKLSGRTMCRTAALYQYDYGQILLIDGIDLPVAYEVHFSNQPHGVSTTQIGGADGVSIPDIYLQSGLPVYAWIYLHTGEDDGETEYSITIPVIQRASISNQEPTPVQQDAITEAIAALNTAVSATGQDVIDAGAAKIAAEAAQTAAETAQGKAEDAQTAAETAQGKAEDAQGAAETAQGKAEDAQTAAETAQGKAEDAQTAAEAAQAAAEAAQDAAEDAQEAIEGLSVSASTLSAGSSATVTKTVNPSTGAVSLAFGIPQGAEGDTGATGQTGPSGADGTTFTPSVAQNGDISWTNDGGKTNPQTVNIKGPAGPGVPPGGSAGDVLVKKTGADNDTEWSDDLSNVKSAVNRLPTEETGQELLDKETGNAGLTETALAVIGLLFDRMPQDETATDIYYSLLLENERLLAIYDIWESERSA